MNISFLFPYKKVHQYDAQRIMTGGLFSYHQKIVRIKQKYHVRQQAEAQGAFSPCTNSTSERISLLYCRICTVRFILNIEYSGRFYTPIPEIGNHRSDMKETAIPF